MRELTRVIGESPLEDQGKPSWEENIWAEVWLFDWWEWPKYVQSWEELSGEREHQMQSFGGTDEPGGFED